MELRSTAFRGPLRLVRQLIDWRPAPSGYESADWLRVDVWPTNERLQHYSLRQGFTYVRTGAGTSAVLTKGTSAELMGQLGRRSDEPDRLVAETGCPCSVGSKERRHDRVLYIAWRADRIERKQ